MANEQVQKEWDQINYMLGIKGPTDEILGALLREYLEESGHGGWDGFQSRDVTGIRRMLSDMYLYWQNQFPIDKSGA